MALLADSTTDCSLVDPKLARPSRRLPGATSNG